MSQITGEKQKECARCWKVYHLSELTRQRGVLVCWRCVDQPQSADSGAQKCSHT